MTEGTITAPTNPGIGFEVNTDLIRSTASRSIMIEPGRDGDGRFDDVLFPITMGRRYVAGEREAGEGGHCDVVGSADAGFEHSAAPNGDII